MRARTLLFSLLLLTSACKTMAVQRRPVGEVVNTSRRPVDLVLELRDGRTVEVWDAAIVGDSVVGFTASKRDRLLDYRQAVAQSDIASVSMLKVNVLRTTLALIGGFVVAFPVYIFAVFAFSS